MKTTIKNAKNELPKKYWSLKKDYTRADIEKMTKSQLQSIVSDIDLALYDNERGLDKNKTLNLLTMICQDLLRR